MQRRERTRHLIELGGLVRKAGLVELMDDDRAALYGALLEFAARLRYVQGTEALALWRRCGGAVANALSISKRRDKMR